MADNKNIDMENEVVKKEEAKKLLNDAIERAESIKAEEYTKDSYNKLHNAVKEGKIVYNSDAFTANETNVATAKIDNAIDALKLSDKVLDKSSGVLSKSETELERVRQENEQNEIKNTNVKEPENLSDLSEEEKQEKLRIEKREKEIQETLNRKDELDKQKMRSDSEISERALGRDSDKERYQEVVTDEKIDHDNINENKDELDESVIEEEKKKSQEELKDRFESFNREERVPNKNINNHLIDEDETLTPAAQMAQEMQDEAEKADAEEKGTESVTDTKGIEKKKNEPTEYDEKIKKKYSHKIEIKNENKETEEFIEKNKIDEEKDEPYISSREERLPNKFKSAIKEKTLTPSAQLAKDMQEATESEENTTESVSKAAGIEDQNKKKDSEYDKKIKEKYGIGSKDKKIEKEEYINTRRERIPQNDLNSVKTETTSKANNIAKDIKGSGAANEGVSMVTSSASEGNSDKESDDQKKKSQAKKAAKASFEIYEEISQKAKEREQQKLGIEQKGANTQKTQPNAPSSFISEASGIETKKEDFNKPETSADKMLRENEEKLSNKHKSIEDKINKRDKIKEKADEELERTKKERFELKQKGRIRNEDLVRGPNNNHIENLKKGTNKVKSVTGAAGISDGKTSDYNVDTSIDKMLKENYETIKLHNEKEVAKYKKPKRGIKTKEERELEKAQIKEEKIFKKNFIDEDVKGKDLNKNLSTPTGIDPKKNDNRFDEITGKLKPKATTSSKITPPYMGGIYDDNLTGKDKENIPKINTSKKDEKVAYKKDLSNLKVDKKRYNYENDKYNGENTTNNKKESQYTKEDKLNQKKYQNTDNISNNGYDSLSRSKGIIVNNKKLETEESVKIKNKGNIKIQKGVIVNTDDIVHHKENGNILLGKNAAGIEDKNNIAAGIKRKEEIVNKNIRNKEKERKEELERIKNREIKNRSATEQYNELARAENNSVKLSRKGQLDGRQFGKNLDNSPNAKINTRFDKLNEKALNSLKKKDLKMKKGNDKFKVSRYNLAGSAEKAKEANAVRNRFLQKQGLSQFNMIGSPAQNIVMPKSKILFKKFFTKTLSVAALSGIAIGSGAGVGGVKKKNESDGQENKWYPTTSHIPEEGLFAEPIPLGATDRKTLSQVAAELVVARLNCYYKQVMNEELSADDIEKGGLNIKPIKRLKIKKFTLNGMPMDPNSITFETVDDFKIDYTYVGTMVFPDGSSKQSTHTEKIGVGAKVANFDFVDRYAQTIGKQWFILDKYSDIKFPDGSYGDGINLVESSELDETGPSPEVPDTLPALEENSSWRSDAGESQWDVMLNMLGALETGGQIYGQRDYGHVKPPLDGAEKTMTIGWSSFYGDNARDYLIRFKEENPDTFKQLDPTGEVDRSLTIGSWVKDGFNASSEWKTSVGNMLTTDNGKLLQDTMTMERLQSHWERCASAYTNDLRAIMWYTQIGELGGRSTAEKLFKSLNGDYSSDNIYKTLKEKFSNGAWSVGSSVYDSRNKKYKEWIEGKVPVGTKVNLKDNAITGNGAAPIGGSTLGSSQNVGMALFVKEMLAMSMTGGFYKDPANKKEYLTYLIDVIDYAVSMDGDEKLGGKRGVALAIDTVPSGGTVTWTEGKGKASAPEMMLFAQFRIPVLSDLKVLEENDPNFKKHWDLKGDENVNTEPEKYGDTTVQSYIALRNKDYEELFNLKLSEVGLGVGGLSYGFGSGGINYEFFDGVTGIPYVDWAIKIANDNRHGYSQLNRNTLVDFDCSSLVWYALKSAGFNLGNGSPFSTATMGPILKRNGFQEFNINSVDQLQVGDIVWKNGHTEIYIGNGNTVGAHISENYSIHGDYGDQTGKEISVVQYWNVYTKAYRPPKEYVDKILADIERQKNKDKEINPSIEDGSNP